MAERTVVCTGCEGRGTVNGIRCGYCLGHGTVIVISFTVPPTNR